MYRAPGLSFGVGRPVEILRYPLGLPFGLDHDQDVPKQSFLTECYAR